MPWPGAGWRRSPRSSAARRRPATCARTRIRRLSRRPTSRQAPPRSRSSSTRSASAAAGTTCGQRGRVTAVPLLAKGFFTAEEDVRTAAEAGADAILILLRDLDDDVCRRLMQAAADRGLDAFVEAHDADELGRALALGADPIGVNARDLSTFAIDRRDAARARRRGAPEGRRSRRRRGERHLEPRPGRRSRARRRRRDPRRLGADACAGSRRQARRAHRAAARQGLRADARGGRGLAAEAGADLAGFILADSPRRAPAPLPVPDTMLSVAVFVGAAEDAGADLVQLYAEENGHRGRDAVLLREGERVARVLDLPGSARTRPLGARPREAEGRVLLAGGLAPENVGAGDRRRSALGGRRGPEPRGGAGDQGSRARARLRAASEARMSVTPPLLWRARSGPLRRLRRALRARRRSCRRSTSSSAAGDEVARRPGLPRRARRARSAPTSAGRPRSTAPSGSRPGERIYLKREDLCHTGAHKINNALGQALLAKRLGKRRIVAETGAGQHGVATATVCARFGLECVVYMGAEDMRRQRPNVERMHLLGAEVRAGRVRHEDAQGGALARRSATGSRTSRRPTT